MKEYMSKSIRSIAALLLLFVAISCQQTPPKDEVVADDPATIKAKMIARADSLELDTPYEAPPGDALAHHTSGYAKVVCSAVFITGLDAEFAAANVGGFSSPFEERTKVGKPEVDYDKKTVSHYVTRWRNAHRHLLGRPKPGMCYPTYW